MAAATTASKVRKHVAQHELRQSLSQALPAGYGSSPETASAENSVLSETTAIPAATARSLAGPVVFLIKEWRTCGISY